MNTKELRSINETALKIKQELTMSKYTSTSEILSKLNRDFINAQNELNHYMPAFNISLYNFAKHIEAYYNMRNNNKDYHVQISVVPQTSINQLEDNKTLYSTLSLYTIKLPNGQPFDIVESLHTLVTENMTQDAANKDIITEEKLLSEEELKHTNINLLVNKEAHIPSVFNPSNPYDDELVNALWYTVGANLYEKRAAKIETLRVQSQEINSQIDELNSSNDIEFCLKR